MSEITAETMARESAARWEAISRKDLAQALRGPSRRSPESAERVPIEIHPKVREALRDLLFEDDMRGVGYSEFIARAIAATRGERL